MDIQALIQSATATIEANPLTDLLVKGAVTIIMGLQLWQIKTTKNIEKMLTEWKVILFGYPEGENGIQKDVKDLQSFKQELIEQGYHPHRRKDD